MAEHSYVPEADSDEQLRNTVRFWGDVFLANVPRLQCILQKNAKAEDEEVVSAKLEVLREQLRIASSLGDFALYSTTAELQSYANGFTGFQSGKLQDPYLAIEAGQPDEATGHVSANSQLLQAMDQASDQEAA